ncbi:hypothetical protein [Brevibacterium sp. VCM10]|uniref:hypothetical protein n=1 Tax=Brevibacterium sp. VCM10 TaxID=1381751 RepID=UPI0004725DCA|nr:hypothetical protein [Brevibacterium sp. VCM10]
MPTNKKTSPKVGAAGISSGVVVIVVAMLSAITPDMLDWAGRWAPVIYAGVPALAAVLGAYIKRDPDRETDATPVPVDYEPKH